LILKSVQQRGYVGSYRSICGSNGLGKSSPGITEAYEVYIVCGAKGIKQKSRDPRKRGLKKRGRGTAEEET